MRSKSNFLKPSFERRLIIVLFIIITFISFLSWLTYSNNKTYKNTFYWVKHTQQVLYLSEEMFSQVKDLERASRGYVLTGDEDFLKPYYKNREVIFTRLRQLKMFMPDDRHQQEFLDSLHYYIEKKLSFLNEGIAFRSGLGLEKAKDHVGSKEGIRYMEAIERIITDIQTTQNRLLTVRERANEKSNFSFSILYLIQTIILLLTVISFGIALWVSLNRRKKTEAQLSENEQLLKSIIDNTASIIYVKNTDGKYVMVNKRYESLSGFSQEQITNKTDFDLYPRELAEMLHASDKKCLQMNRLIQFMEDIPYKNNLLHCYSIRFPVYKADGRMYGTCGIITDITDVMLQEKLERQKQITEAMIEAQEKQRSAIGRELHDNVNQILATAAIMIDTASSVPGLHDICLEKSRKCIRDAISEVRTISHSLIMPSFEKEDFTDSIKEIVDNLNLSQRINARLQLSCEEKLNNLNDKVKLALYRITQEQVNNVIKYAKAPDVVIHVKVKGPEVHLSVSDNGQGFNTRGRPKGTGLKNMENRVEMLEGKMEIVSAPGHGCTLKVHIPV